MIRRHSDVSPPHKNDAVSVSRLRQIPQHRVQDAAVAVVLDLDGGVDAAGGDEVDSLAVRFNRGDFDRLTWFEVVAEGDLEGFAAVEFQEVAGLSFAGASLADLSFAAGACSVFSFSVCFLR